MTLKIAKIKNCKKLHLYKLHKKTIFSIFVRQVVKKEEEKLSTI